MVKRYNIVTASEYESNGETKKKWHNVGKLIDFPDNERGKGGFKVELSMFPDTQFYVFEEKSKDEWGNQDQASAPQEGEAIQAEDGGGEVL